MLEFLGTQRQLDAARNDLRLLPLNRWFYCYGEREMIQLGTKVKRLPDTLDCEDIIQMVDHAGNWVFVAWEDLSATPLNCS